MSTITEDYISFETAKLLKEKGFAQNCATYYLDGQVWRHYYGEVIPKGKQIYAAPTQAIAMKWLRNTFYLEIYPFHDAIQENNDWWYRVERHSKGCSFTEHESDDFYKTYEQTCEAAIKYCLEHLI